VVNNFLNFPCTRHWNAVFCILQHIKDVHGKGLLYGHNNLTRVVGYSDVDWDGFPGDPPPDIVSLGPLCALPILRERLPMWRQGSENSVTGLENIGKEVSAIVGRHCDLERGGKPLT